MPASSVVINDLQTTIAINPQSISANTSSAAIDLTNFDGVIGVLFALGALGSTTAGITVTTDSASGGAFATTVVTAATFNAANQIQLTPIDTRACLRYIKVNVVLTGAAATLVSASLVEFKKVK